jgi:hypothetical protein
MAEKSFRISSFFNTGNFEVLTPHISTLLIKRSPLCSNGASFKIVYLAVKNYSQTAKKDESQLLAIHGTAAKRLDLRLFIRSGRFLTSIIDIN